MENETIVFEQDNLISELVPKEVVTFFGDFLWIVLILVVIIAGLHTFFNYKKYKKVMERESRRFENIELVIHFEKTDFSNNEKLEGNNES